MHIRMRILILMQIMMRILIFTVFDTDADPGPTFRMMWIRILIFS
jgi:hypothetical protein